jgi:hypothetical protein
MSLSNTTWSKMASENALDLMCQREVANQEKKSGNVVWWNRLKESIDKNRSSLIVDETKCRVISLFN